MNEGTKKRLFIAVSIPREILDGLHELQQKLKPFARDAKWVKAEGMHLTLKFLGYVEPERIPAIVDALKPVAMASNSFSVQVRGCGFFPNTRRPSVLWAGVVSQALESLQQSVEQAMVQIGFEKEDRAFTPHLTLSRFRDSRGLTPLILEVDQHKETELGEFTAREFILFESILHREGAEYRKVETYSFS